MKRIGLVVSTLALALAPPVLAQTAAPMTPAQAIAAAASREVNGVFEMQVGSAAGVGFVVYLNSEADYRSPANLTIQLNANAVNELKAKLGGFPEDVLKGKRLRVTGTARRVELGGRDGTKNYQTRIEVETARQITVLN